MTPKRIRDSEDDPVPTSGPVASIADQNNLRKKLKKSITYDPVAYQFLREVGASDAFFNNGEVLACALQPDEDAYLNIANYVKQGQPDVYVREAEGYFEILSMLRIIPKTDRPLSFNEDPKWQGKQRKMLWHGTDKANVISILENGFRLPTGNKNGKYLGEGIYFGDTILQSGNYCTYNADEAGEEVDLDSLYLFLCDVVLGEAQKETMYQMDRSRWRHCCHLDIPSFQPKMGYDSVKGCGMKAPDPEWNREIDGCTWPLGLLTKNGEDPGQLGFNEYVIYKTEQVQPKFLVNVKYIYVTEWNEDFE